MKRLAVRHSRHPALWQSAMDRVGRQYGDHDPRWVTCVFVYFGYLAAGRRLRYHDWLRDGNGDPDYGVIARRLPNDGKVAILGDWGTGQPDAAALLEEVLAKHKPCAIVHLGDVYYAGTRAEYRAKFLRVLEAAFRKHGRVPVFAIPGNHDYYSGGGGFYRALRELNEPGWQQEASFFCLRTEDGRQLIGIDTGQSDVDPLVKVPLHTPKPVIPRIRTTERVWLSVQLTAPTILLSHHQVLSAHATVAPGTPRPYVNPHLLSLAGEQVVAWFWGHEHSLALYEDGLLGLAKGRLVGASAYEEVHAEDPYEVRHPEVRYWLDAQGQVVRTGQVDGYFNHSYAIVDLGAWTASYYQIPSAAAEPVALPPGMPWCLATESLGAAG